MSKVYCAAVECEFLNDDNQCTRDEINLSEGYYHTMNEGVKHVWICKYYKQGERAKDIEAFIQEAMRRRND